MTAMNPLNPNLNVFAVSTVELSLRMGLALVLIVTIITGGTALAKKRGGRAKHTPVTIRHQQQLTKHTTLTLLTAGQQHLLIATNNQTTTLLAQGPTLTTTGVTDNGTQTSGIDIDIRTPNTPTPKPTTTTTNGGGGGGGGGGGKPRTLNPLKQLQNKTVRRA
ncbi:MAG: hypothetical protein ACRBK7_32325 [Acidimicrobiales bacterium]